MEGSGWPSRFSISRVSGSPSRVRNVGKGKGPLAGKGHRVPAHPRGQGGTCGSRLARRCPAASWPAPRAGVAAFPQSVERLAAWVRPAPGRTSPDARTAGITPQPGQDLTAMRQHGARGLGSRGRAPCYPQDLGLERRWRQAARIARVQNAISPCRFLLQEPKTMI